MIPQEYIHTVLQGPPQHLGPTIAREKNEYLERRRCRDVHKNTAESVWPEV